MNIQVLQHVPFEGPGAIGKWMQDHGHTLITTKLFADEPLPTLNTFDGLIIMGGPMGVNDADQYPWLKPEAALIADAVDSGKYVLGICLGAQLIANALGARVYPNKQKEIGWFNLTRTLDAADSPVGQALPQTLTAFHWHGDTFDLPQGATLLASSTACRNQAFLAGSRTLGLQFHLETTPESADNLLQNCGGELVEAEYIQTADQIRAGCHQCSALNEVMGKILTALFSAE